MEAIEMIKERRSIRKYKQEKVSRDTLKLIVDAASYSPSWANQQIARYTFVDKEELIKEIADKGVKGFAYNIKTLQTAPGVLVLSYEIGKSGKLGGVDGDKIKENMWEMFDSGIACQTFCLAAHNYGVGTCIFGVIDEEEIAKIVDLPKTETVAAIIVYGYPESKGTVPPKKELNEIMRFVD